MIRGSFVVDLLAIALGGAIGAVLRHLITRFATAIPGGASHFGTLAANVVGCLGIGVLAGCLAVGGPMSDRYQLALRTGLLGGLTTFSTFAFESVTLAEQQRWTAFALYMLANLVLGLLAVMLGIVLGRHLAS